MNDGVPAFPIQSLRDYFAAKAMQALITACPPGLPIASFPAVATEAYAMSDAMLAEKQKVRA